MYNDLEFKIPNSLRKSTVENKFGFLKINLSSEFREIIRSEIEYDIYFLIYNLE